MCTMNVGVGFFTGRRNFKNLIKTHIRNWDEHGLIKNMNVRLNLFITYDLKYSDAKLSDYKKLDEEVYNMVDSVSLIGKTDITNEAKYLVDRKVVNREEVKMIFGEGYAKRRNTILYHAIKNKMDCLMFLDDDEYPLASLKEKGRLMWAGQNVLGTHINNIENADITHGYHCGYISPIPNIKFDRTLTEEDFKIFINAISNDIISWSSIEKNGGVTYADSDIVANGQVTEVKEINGCKFISGSNLCLNLKNKGKLFPFYNPPGARGEDTFLSTCLSDLTVKKLPIYTFHDGFLHYTSMLHGVLPQKLKKITGNSSQTVSRFLKASIGWVRYKPLLLYITKRSEYETEMMKMRESLSFVVPKLCTYFNNRGFYEILDSLEYYHRNVEKHYHAFEETKKTWKKVTDFILNDDHSDSNTDIAESGHVTA